MARINLPDQVQGGLSPTFGGVSEVTQNNEVLSASTKTRALQNLEINSAYSFEIPATSSLVIEPVAYVGPASAVAISGGILDGVTIGSNTPAPSITATQLATDANVNYGTTPNPWLYQRGIVFGTLPVGATAGAVVNQLAYNDQIVGNSLYSKGLIVWGNIVSPAVGPRLAVEGLLTIASVGANALLQAQYVGVHGRTQTAVNLGGVAGTDIGMLWGGWFEAVTTGGDHHYSVIGVEIDVQVASSVQLKVGLRVTTQSGDTTQGTCEDAALQVMKGNTASTWTHGIKFGTDQGNVYGSSPANTTASWPFNSSSTMIGTSVVGNGLAAGIGIDFSNITFSTAAIKVPAAILPSTANAVPLGSSTAYWSDVYTNVLAFEGTSPAITGNPALGTPASVTLTNATGLPLAGLASGTYSTIPTASTLTEWDTNVNLSANAFIPGSTNIATAAGTTTMTIASTQTQVFTGTTTQTVKLPTTGVAAGQSYVIVNQSSGLVTVQSSAGNSVALLGQNRLLTVTSLFAAPTTAGGWTGFVETSGKAPIFSNSIGFVGTDSTTMTFPSSSDTVVGLAATQTLTNKTIIPALTSTATAAGTTTLVVTSTPTQVFTGTTTQTVLLPTTGVAAGQHWTIINTSTGTVTVQSSAGNAITNGTLAAGAGAVFTALVATPTTAANWFAH